MGDGLTKDIVGTWQSRFDNIGGEFSHDLPWRVPVSICTGDRSLASTIITEAIMLAHYSST